MMIKSKPILSQEQPVKVIPYYVGHFLIYLGLLIVALVIVWLAFKANRIYTTYRVTTQHLDTLEAFVATGQVNPATLDMAQVEGGFRGMAQSLETLDEELVPFLPLTPYLGWVPIYGGNLQALPDLLTISRDLSQTGMILIDALSPALRHGTEVGGPLPDIVAGLVQAKADIEQAEMVLRQHQVTINELDIERLSPGVARRAAQLSQYLPQVISGLQLAQSVPTLLGVESPRTYLILAQNSDELRPTGGYINAAGYIVFDRGQIVEFVMEDSYAVDQLSETYPYPPDPIRQYMAADYWVLRDASWSPDFPTTARTAMGLYKLGQGISADGVIAFDQQALPYLLRVFEPVLVEGEQVTGNNVIKLMHKHWTPAAGQDLNREWWSQRKSFMIAVAETIRQKIERDAGDINLPVLANVLQQTLAEKHILIYLEEPTWDSFLTEKNWSGSLSQVNSDYLMIVDANLGFNKASVIVERQLSYQVDLAEDGSGQAQVNLAYRHPAKKRAEDCSQEPRYDPVYEQNMARCYWNYPRLIVPRGAQLVSGPHIIVEGKYLLRGQPTTGEIEVAPVGSDKISWGQLFLLAPQESISLDYVYSLPPDTAHFVEDHWEYSLYLQKQPGTLASPIEVIITLPEKAQFLDSQPLPSSQRERAMTYQLSLKTDQEINILYTFP